MVRGEYRPTKHKEMEVINARDGEARTHIEMPMGLKAISKAAGVCRIKSELI